MFHCTNLKFEEASALVAKFKGLSTLILGDGILSIWLFNKFCVTSLQLNLVELYKILLIL